MLIHLNGKILNEDHGTISINNRSFRYGDGCFETMRMVKGQIINPMLHMDRLFHAIHALQFETPSYCTPEFILHSITQLAQRNGHHARVRVRLTIFRGNGGLYDAQNMQANILIQTWPLNPANDDLNENGLIIGTYDGGFKAADAWANIKSNNFLLYAMAALHAKQQHWNDALVLNHKGNYADATIANLFIITDKQIITPPLQDGPVAGTMRRYLLQQLPALGYKVKEEPITPEVLQQAEECFLTNAIYGIRWVRQHGNDSYLFRHTAQIHAALIAPLFKGAGS